MADLYLMPIHLRNTWNFWLYPAFNKSSLFGTHLLLNPGHDTSRLKVFNVGAHDLELVLFPYLKRIWSVGYVRKPETGFAPVEQWLVSVKLHEN